MQKKRPLRRILLLSAALFALLILGGGVYLYLTQPIALLPRRPLQIAQEPDLGAPLTAEQASADAAQMADFLEQVHPLFLDGQPDWYREAKREYLAAAPECGTVRAFRTATSRFLSSMNDGHTHVYWTDSAALDVNWSWQGGSLIAGPGCALPEGSRVVSVGGVPVEAIRSVVGELMPAENDASLAAGMEKYARNPSVLEEAGAAPADRYAVSVLDGGVPKTIDVPCRQVQNGGQSLPPAEYREEDGIFFVTLRECDPGEDADRTASALKSAVAGGIRKAVIDVRGNPGGNSDVCLNLLHAMGMEPGSYGSIVRFSGPAADQNGLLRRSGSVRFAPDVRSVPNPAVKLCILTDQNTFSSATMLAVWVRDGHLGTIVGQPSGNKPSSYGDIIGFQLKSSKLYGSVSYKQWLRPDSSRNDEKELVPDVPVPEGGDALQAAVDFLNGR